MRTLVYLKAQSVVWIGFHRRKIVKVQEQQFKAGDGSFESCDWLGNKHRTLPLILDCTVEEIDRYPLKITGNFFEQRSNAKALRRKLIDRFPQSIVQTPKAKANVGALILTQFQLTQAQLAWLKSAEKNKIGFSSLLTASAVMADYVNGQSGSELNDQALLVTCIDGVLKHLYCSSGYGLLVRCFYRESDNNSHPTKPDNFLSELTETITHLQMLDSVVAPLTLCVLGLSDQQLEQVRQLDSVATVKSLNSNLHASRENVFVSQTWVEHHGFSVVLAGHYVNSTSLNKNQGIDSGSPAELNCFNQRNSKQGALLLLPLALATCLLVIQAVVIERDRYAALQTHVQKKSAVVQDIEKYQEELLEIGENAVPLGNALRHVERVQSAKALNPALLLAIIAGVLAEHKQLQLLNIAWSVVDVKESDYVAHIPVQGSAQVRSQGRVNGSVLGDVQGNTQTDVQISSRNLSITERFLPSSIRVSLSGLAKADQTLREQQTLVNSMANAFAIHPETSNVIIAETPLMNANQSNRLKDSNQSLAFRILFDVVLSVTVPVPDEA